MDKPKSETTDEGYALFKDGAQVSKVHRLRDVVVIEAFTRKVVVSVPQDFWSDPPGGLCLADGYEIRNTPMPKETPEEALQRVMGALGHGG
jgi:hypothetical protein